MGEIYWRIQGIEGQIQGCLASALRSWDSRKLNTSLYFFGVEIFRAEISRLRIGRISSPEFGELRVWWVFLFRDWWLSSPTFPCIRPMN